MEGLRVGHDPVDRQSGDMLEGYEWGRFSSVGRGDYIRGRQTVAVEGSVLCEWSIFVRVEGVWLVRAPEVDLC